MRILVKTLIDPALVQWWSLGLITVAREIEWLWLASLCLPYLWRGWGWSMVLKLIAQQGQCELRRNASSKKGFGYVHHSCSCVSFSRFLENLMYMPQADAFVIWDREKRKCGWLHIRRSYVLHTWTDLSAAVIQVCDSETHVNVHTVSQISFCCVY